ncbi:hypothetical protein SAY86_002575 [Trapa natans]|uniref:Uncharacterized protein n=1 Tax=Trapa natans TaxID=22666 RepID=A0AAN7LTS2_TRANT|nr:hypothetical protein SAY86_002575 [Trapa natans]
MQCIDSRRPCGPNANLTRGEPNSAANDVLGSTRPPPSVLPKSAINYSRLHRGGAGFEAVAPWGRDVGYRWSKPSGIRASMVDSYESSSDFFKRMEQAWLISQQPKPISCSSCDSRGHVECKWCGGTGFFILGDNMLCQVPSRNTSCVICTGKVRIEFELTSIASVIIDNIS